MLAQSLREDFHLDRFALLRVMSEFLKFLICFFLCWCLYGILVHTDVYQPVSYGTAVYLTMCN